MKESLIFCAEIHNISLSHFHHPAPLVYLISQGWNTFEEYKNIINKSHSINRCTYCIYCVYRAKGQPTTMPECVYMQLTYTNMACRTVTCALVTCVLRVGGMFACFSYGCAVRGHVAHSKRSALRSGTHCSRHRLVTQHTHTYTHIHRGLIMENYLSICTYLPNALYRPHPHQITPLRIAFLPL